MGRVSGVVGGIAGKMEVLEESLDTYLDVCTFDRVPWVLRGLSVLLTRGTWTHLDTGRAVSINPRQAMMLCSRLLGRPLHDSPLPRRHWLFPAARRRVLSMMERVAWKHV